MSTHLTPAVSRQDHAQGTDTAPLTLVEYGDYQCPYCGQAYLLITAAQQALGPDLRFVFRNFPLADAHPDAQPASLAAEAAGRQDKFWEMHDALYLHQGQLGAEHLLGYAKTLGLDIVQFKADCQLPALAAKVAADLESGSRSGVNGTPSFFVNGRKYDGDWEGTGLLHYLQNQLQQQSTHR